MSDKRRDILAYMSLISDLYNIRFFNVLNFLELIKPMKNRKVQSSVSLNKKILPTYLALKVSIIQIDSKLLQNM